MEVLLQPQRTRDKTRELHRHGREEAEFARSSHVSTFPRRCNTLCSASPELRLQEKPGEKRGIVPAAAAAWAEPAGKGGARNGPARMAEFGNAELRAEANPCLECKPQQLQPRAGSENPFSCKSCLFLLTPCINSDSRCSSGRGLKAELAPAHLGQALGWSSPPLQELKATNSSGDAAELRLSCWLCLTSPEFNQKRVKEEIHSANFNLKPVIQEFLSCCFQAGLSSERTRTFPSLLVSPPPVLRSHKPFRMCSPG